MCAGVGILLGGGPVVILAAFLSAVVIDRMQLVLARRRLPFFYQQVAGGAIATIIAVGAAGAGLVGNPSLVVTANIIMLLAGIGFMGALQDALSGFYVTVERPAGRGAARHRRHHRRRQRRTRTGRCDRCRRRSDRGALRGLGGHHHAGARRRHRGGGLRVLVVRPAADHRPDRRDRRRRDPGLPVVRRRGVRPRVADCDRGVPRRSDQLHRGRPTCGCHRWSSWCRPSSRCCRGCRSTAGSR